MLSSCLLPSLITWNCSGDAPRGRGRGRAPRKPRRALKRIYKEDSDEEPYGKKAAPKPWEQEDPEEDVLLSSIWS